MRSTWSMCGLTIFASLGLSLFPSPEAMAGADEGGESDRVTVIETPDGGIQPQAAIDAKGVIHLIYFQGLPSGGDLFYARRGRAKLGSRRRSGSTASPAPPSRRGRSVAARSRLGKGRRVHVAWNGSIDALPKDPLPWQRRCSTRDPTKVGPRSSRSGTLWSAHPPWMEAGPSPPTAKETSTWAGTASPRVRPRARQDGGCG